MSACYFGDNIPKYIDERKHLSIYGNKRRVWLAEHDRGTNPEIGGDGRYGAGVGIYSFEEPRARGRRIMSTVGDVMVWLRTMEISTCWWYVIPISRPAMQVIDDYMTIGSNSATDSQPGLTGRQGHCVEKVPVIFLCFFNKALSVLAETFFKFFRQGGRIGMFGTP